MRKMKQFLIILTNFILIFSCMPERLNAYDLYSGIGAPVPDMSNTVTYGRILDMPVTELPDDSIYDAALNDNAPLADENTPTSGICGDSVSWSFDRQSGLLTVSGQGDMYDYDYDGGYYAPWHPFREEITDILISLGITSIGNNSFRGLTKATTATVSESVSKIGNNSFSNCYQLKEVSLSDSIVYIGYNAFANTDYMRNLRSADGYYITPNGYLLKCDNVAESVSVPENVKLIASQAFYYPYWTKLYYAEINSDCIICDEAFIFCYELEKIVINGSCKVSGSMIKYGDGLKSITVNGDCTIEDGALADWCNILDTVTINGRIITNGSLAINCPKLNKISYNAERAKPAVKDNTTGKANHAVSSTQRANVPYNTYGVNCPYAGDFGMGIEYNNGFGFYSVRERIQEIESPSNKVFAVYGDKNKATVISKDTLSTVFAVSKPGFDFGGAVIDDQYLYIMWSYVISIEGSESRLSENNIVFSKYDMNGKLIGECGLSLNDTQAQEPLGGGNCSMRIKNGVLGCFYNISWLNGHQGSEFVAIKTDTMQRLALSTWQGSHSFGTCLRTTKYGFVGIQMGDCYPRGINLNTYTVNNDNVKINTDNKVLLSCSGQYGENGVHQNNTHVHMGGLAVGNTTYAVAGKAERSYTSGNYAEFVAAYPQKTQIFDVFIRIADQTLLKTDDIGGEDRIDAATGEVADTNVFWLTSCNSTVKAGQVKVVTLENGAYCVLWERMVNDKFDSIRYVIMDECGNILRHETGIYGARLSNTSIQPIVQGNRLTWATADAEAGKVTWYTVNLDAFGDVNKDGATTLDDAILTLRKAMNVNIGATAFDEIEADINSDGEITLNDAVEILKMAMKVTS